MDPGIRIWIFILKQEKIFHTMIEFIVMGFVLSRFSIPSVCYF